MSDLNERVFDLWLHADLAVRYDPALREAVPEALLAILAETAAPGAEPGR